MARILVFLLTVWVFFDIINVVFLGQLTARSNAGEEERRNWFVFAVLGGPVFTIFAFLMYFFHSSEDHYLKSERRAKARKEAKMYRDIFKDGD